MFIVLSSLTIIVFCLLILMAAMRPGRPKLSNYELKRRAASGDSAAHKMIEKNKQLDDVESILKIKIAFLLVVTSFLLVVLFGWLIGCLIALVVVLFYGSIARLKFVTKLANKLYQLIEPILLISISKITGFMPLVRSVMTPDTPIKLGSTQELAYLVDQSDGVLSSDEKSLIVHSLAFSDKTVADIMTPVSEIKSVKKTEFLGPLTLDELHQFGHSRLPVIGPDINHIVGILRLQNLLALDQKRSVTAEKAMDTHVMYIRSDHTLPQALAALLRTHQHLFVVVDEKRLTVGLITLDDVIEALIGHKIKDEFDDHESLRSVSARQANHDGLDKP